MVLELDRGGPADRCHAVRMYPDFAFPQLQQPCWLAIRRPAFTDYLYLSFTNAISFSARDAAPLTRWAKLMMMLRRPARWRPSRSSSPAL